MTHRIHAMHRSRPSVTRTCTVQFVDAAVELILATLELRYVKMVSCKRLLSVCQS